MNVRFGFSNLVWNQLPRDTQVSIVHTCEVCDFGPTMHFGGWAKVPEKLPSWPYGTPGPAIAALQSLFFGITSASLVQDERAFEALLNHWKYIVALAARSHVPKLIFGSPGVRSRRHPDADTDVLERRVRELSDVCRQYNVILCFEVNSGRFGCEFLSSMREYHAFFANFSHSALGRHLDLGQLSEEGLDPMEEIDRAGDRLAHLHLSNSKYDFEASDVSLYVKIINHLQRKDAKNDVILEVQKIEASAIPDFVRAIGVLSRACRQ
jgi:hypothetical protein